jgi:DNA mismatch repair protein MLH1
LQKGAHTSPVGVPRTSLTPSTNQVGTSAPDLSTPSSTTKQAIRLLYGQGVAKDLLTADVSAPKRGKRKRDTNDDRPAGGMPDGDSSWMAQAHFTNANYHSKKSVLLLFINSENSSSTVLAHV